jgi:hypothetical protein
MTNLCKVHTAGTSFPNTPESDLQPTVMCDVYVTLADGTAATVRIKARDPLVAMERVKSMTDDEVAALPRAPSN